MAKGVVYIIVALLFVALLYAPVVWALYSTGHPILSSLVWSVGVLHLCTTIGRMK